MARMVLAQPATVTVLAAEGGLVCIELCNRCTVHIFFTPIQNGYGLFQPDVQPIQ